MRPSFSLGFFSCALEFLVFTVHPLLGFSSVIFASSSATPLPFLPTIPNPLLFFFDQLKKKRPAFVLLRLLLRSFVALPFLSFLFVCTTRAFFVRATPSSPVCASPSSSLAAWSTKRLYDWRLRFALWSYRIVLRETFLSLSRKKRLGLHRRDVRLCLDRSSEE